MTVRGHPHDAEVLIYCGSCDCNQNKPGTKILHQAKPQRFRRCETDPAKSVSQRRVPCALTWRMDPEAQWDHFNLTGSAGFGMQSKSSLASHRYNGSHFEPWKQGFFCLTLLFLDEYGHITRTTSGTY